MILFLLWFSSITGTIQIQAKHLKRRGLMMGDKTPNKPPKKKQKSEKKSATQSTIMKETSVKKPKK